MGFSFRRRRGREGLRVESVAAPAASGASDHTLDRRGRELFEAIDDAVFVHDLDGRILDANPAACRRLGYTRGKKGGKKGTQLISVARYLKKRCVPLFPP